MGIGYAIARTLAQEYRRRMRDATFEAVLPFYQCHRSLVRGKVRGFAWLQHPRSAEGHRVRGISERHFQLAVRYAKEFALPRLIIVGGLIGSGKSTLAKQLAEGLGAEWLRTDEIRLTEFAQLRDDHGGFKQGLYSSRVSNLVYQRLIRRAEASLRSGRSVVCDGTFSMAQGREQLRRIAAQRRASFHFFECVVPRSVALARVAARAAVGSDISEARPEHYDRLKAGYEPPPRWPASAWTRISDNRPAKATYKAALAALRRAWRA
jgi:predicted kinase